MYLDRQSGIFFSPDVVPSLQMQPTSPQWTIL